MRNPVEKSLVVHRFGRTALLPMTTAALLMVTLGIGCPNADLLSASSDESADAASQLDGADTVNKADSAGAAASKGVVVVQADGATHDADPSAPGRILVKFRDDVDDTQRKNILAEENANESGSIPQVGVKIVELPAQASEKAALNAFRQRPQVEFAELDSLLAAEAVPNDPYYSSEWHLPAIAAPTAWDSVTGSAGVIIAILDTGCDPTHPDLAPQYVSGWNVYDSNSNTSDVHGHGTAVAGTAAAASNNAGGVASIAWGCRVMPIRVTDAGGTAAISALANGLVWAADHGARVANISFMATGYATVTSGAQYFESKGGVVTISAGNYSTFDASADNKDVLTVSASDSNDAIASFSNTGNNIDLAAPGVYIYTTNNGGGYGAWSGTSFSAPVVAGVAGLVISANPNLSASQIQDVLKQSADDLGTPGKDPSYGSGRVNAARAVTLALSTGAPAPDTTPPGVSFASPADGDAVAGAVSVQVNASDNVGVASVSLFVDGVSMATDTTSPYAFSWITSTVLNGMHTLQVTARDAAGNTATDSIQVTVSNAIDTTPPSVSIVSPVAGATVSGTSYVTVSAADNVGVVKVALYVDGVLNTSSTSAPFTTKLNTRKVKAGTHTLQCMAYDAAGNTATSATVSVKR